MDDSTLRISAMSQNRQPGPLTDYRVREGGLLLLALGNIVCNGTSLVMAAKLSYEGCGGAMVCLEIGA